MFIWGNAFLLNKQTRAFDQASRSFSENISFSGEMYFVLFTRKS